MERITALAAIGAVALPMAMPVSADVIEIEVQVTNLAPANGTYLTPVWFGFHDGAFDLYDAGSPASLMLERLAEDGMTAPVHDAFIASGTGFLDATLVADGGIPPLAPGGTATRRFRLNTELGSSRFASFASMVIPSNDAFIANGDPMGIEVVSADGQFLGADIVVMGGMVRDAGTEVNDELPMNTAFFGQMRPNTGVSEGGVVATHPGFLPVGSGGILDSAMFAGADFTQPGYAVARISIREVRRLTVQVTSLAPEFGVGVTPVWAGLHDGSFDLYDLGAVAGMPLERLAEDGDTGPLSEAFAASGSGAIDATLPADVGIPVILPGGTATGTFEVDPHAAIGRYMSFAAMVVPSNDAFVGNADPMALPLFDAAGSFLGVDRTITGDMVRDAGTEVNDELPMNTAFFGQMTPDTGVSEFGFVQQHPGFLPVGSGGVLDAPMFAAADFTTAGYEVARIVVTQEPAASADLDGDGMVGPTDLAVLLGDWGFRPGSAADLDADGTVDSDDVSLLLGAWGSTG